MTGAGRLGGRGPVVGPAPIPVALPGVLSAHPLILPFRLASLLAAQLFDFGTFTLMIARHGIASELNPLVAHGFAAFGLPFLAISKLALVVLLAAIVVILGQDRPRHRSVPGLAATITVLAVVAGLVGGISNVLVG